MSYVSVNLNFKNSMSYFYETYTLTSFPSVSKRCI